MHPKRIPSSRERTPSEYQALGRAVRELRGRRKLSQAALARRCRTHRNYIGALEQGRLNPTFASVVRLLQGLDVTLVEIAASYDAHFRPQPRPLGPKGVRVVPMSAGVPVG